jgi:hypothetical protein
MIVTGCRSKRQLDVSYQRLPFILKNSAPFIAKVGRDSKVKVWKDNLDLLSELDDFLR